MHAVVVYVNEGLPFARYLQKTVRIVTYLFDWLYYTQCLTFSSIDHLLRFYARF